MLANNLLHRMKAPLVFALFFSAALQAELLPELEPAAAQYRADLAAVKTQEVEAIALARSRYVAALDAADKAASANGQVASAATLTKERAAVELGNLPPAAPADLPKGLQGQRKSFQDARARAAADAALRQQNVDAAYLRTLSALQTRAPANSELAKQIANEKNSLLERASIGANRKLFDTQWTAGQNTLHLHADATITSSFGAKGTWKLKGNKFFLQWNNGKPAEEWTLDSNSKTLSNSSRDKYHRK